MATDPESPIVAAATEKGLRLRVHVEEHKRLEVAIEGEIIRLQECFSDRAAITLETSPSTEEPPVWTKVMHVYPACGLSEQHPAELTILARCFQGVLSAQTLAAAFAVVAAHSLGFKRLQPALVVCDADVKSGFLQQLQECMTEGVHCLIKDNDLPNPSMVSRKIPRAKAWSLLLEALHLPADAISMEGDKFRSRSYDYWQTPLQRSKESVRVFDDATDTD